MSVNKCVAIVNPHGGLRRGLSVLDEIGRSLSDAGVALDSHVTRHPQHAIELAREVSLADYDCLCVVGGDGTVHDVVGGLMLRDERPDIPIALVPAGTGNTLHRDLNCSNVARAGEAILGGKTRWLDVVEVRSLGQVTYCVNIIGWGGMADINVKAEKLRMLGPSRYALASLWQIMRPIDRYAKLTLDDDVIEDNFQFVIACVTKSTGTGMLLAPQAEIDDGNVDLVFLRKATRWQMLQLFRRVFDGSHLELPFVDYRQVRTFGIDAGESKLNLDGEVKGTSPFTAEVIPRAMRVLCNTKHGEVAS